MNYFRFIVVILVEAVVATESHASEYISRVTQRGLMVWGARLAIHTHTQDLFPKQCCVGGRLFINCVIELYPLALFVGLSKAKTAVGIKYLDVIVHPSEFLDYQSIDIPAQNFCGIWTKNQWFRIFIPHSIPSFSICFSDVFLFLLTSDVCNFKAVN